MADLLALHAGLHPDKPALILGDQVRTYAELNRRANRVAHALADLGIGPNDRVAAASHNSLEGSEAAAGCRKLGAGWVSVNFRLRDAELAYVISDSGARAVLAGRNMIEAVEEARHLAPPGVVYIGVSETPPAGWLSYESLLARASEGEAAGDDASPVGPSMTYTSGTTGHPKGAERRRGIPVERIMQMIQVFELSQDDVHLMAGPGYHSAVGLFSVLTMAMGGTIVIMPHYDAEEALRLIERHRVTATFMAPILLHRIMDLPDEVLDRYDTSSLRAVILGAAPCPASLKERAIARLGPVLWEFYGATETGINLVLRPEDQLRKPGSAGRPVEGQDIVLLDDEGRPVPDGVPGQLWVRHDWLSEYHEKPEATRQAMRDGYFTVGDIAYRDAEGFYYICDRKIDMVISGGVNIYPAEVEACLHEHPDVSDAAVIGVPDPEWGESVKAVVVRRAGAATTEQELIDWCRSRIADYKRPRSVDFVDELPRDAAGKLLKRTIRAPYWDGAQRLL
jgi:acyl-CoA synthetase (AMP-forming)/AMP-acid ligase II